MRRGLASVVVACGVFGLAAACATEREPEEAIFLEGGAPPRDAGRDAAPIEVDAACGAGDPACDDAGDGGEAGAPPDGGVCGAKNTCATARDLGAVSGDNNADQVMASGSVGEWLSVRVREDSTVAGASLRARFSLVSPPGANFDLFVSYDALRDVVRCAPPPTLSSTQQAGISDAVSAVWGEGAVPNGSDDSRTLRVEVRHVSGDCPPGAQWTLLVQGNTP